MDYEKTLYYICDSDKLISEIVSNGDMELIGIGDRFDDKFSGLHSDLLKCDNTYNWEIISEGDDGEQEITSLSNDFEIRENDSLIIISKHIGQDIRAGYENEMIYIKKNSDVSFYNLVVDNMYQVRELEK
jgi:hypothetical protein